MNNEFSIIIPSNRDQLQLETAVHFNKMDIHPYLKNGHNYLSFAQLVNHCIVESPTEIIIICNDKARPTLDNLNTTLDLINSGIGFVAPYCFGFFGFKKELIRKVGFLDERYIGGNYEDCDFIRRLNEADISAYLTYEIPYKEHIPSGWIKGPSAIHYSNKWIDCSPENLVCIRKLEEEKYDYDIGPPTGEEFLPWGHTTMSVGDWFKQVKIERMK